MSDRISDTTTLPPCGDDLCEPGCTVCREGGPLDQPETTDAELIPAVKVGQTWRQRKIGGAWRTVVGIHPAGVEWTAKPDRHEMSSWENWDRWVRDTEAEAHE